MNKVNWKKAGVIDTRPFSLRIAWEDDCELTCFAFAGFLIRHTLERSPSAKHISTSMSSRSVKRDG